MNWALNFAAADAEHKAEWKELMAPTGIGLILRSIRTDYKFVRSDIAACRRPFVWGYTASGMSHHLPETRFRWGDGVHSQVNVADCVQPMKYPDRVTVLHKLKDKPKSDSDHFILDVVILSELHRRPAARCVEDIAVYDYRAARKSAMKPFMIKKLQETYDLQEQAKQTYGNKVLNLIRRVKRLEQGTWDRADAKEDLGSADP